MTGRGTTWNTQTRIILVLAGLCFAALLPAVASAQDAPLRLNLRNPSESARIQVSADEVSTWSNGNDQILILQGKVYVEQGLTTIRGDQAILWVEEAPGKAGRLCSIDLYVEGNGKVVAIDQGTKRQQVSAGLIQLTTTGDLAIQSRAKKIAKADRSDEPLFERALSQRSPVTTTTTLPRPPSDIVQTAGVETTSGKPWNGLLATPTSQQSQPVQQLPDLPDPPRVVPLGPPEMSPPPGPPPTAPFGGLAAPPPANGEPRQINIRPRSSQEIQATRKLLPTGETAWIVTSGIILTVTNPADKKGVIDIEADRLVFWTQAGNAQELFSNMRSSEGQTSRSLEFYLSGNVEIRNQIRGDMTILRADECYYDVGRNVAIASRADLELRSPKTVYPVHFSADEIVQLGPKVFEGRQAKIYSTILPSDPGLTLELREARLEETDQPRVSIFGRPFTTVDGERVSGNKKILSGRSATLRAEGIPFFYLPRFKTDAEDPLGPLDNIGIGYSNIFGFQLMTTWNVFDLIGVTPEDGTRWQLMGDYLSRRGPALGSTFQSAGKELFNVPNRFEIFAKLYGIYDQGTDILGGDRGTRAYTGPNTFVPITHPDWRGRATARTNILDLDYGFTVQAQVSAISDRNFLEQYFYNEWNNDLNQETFLYVKQQTDHAAWTLLAEPRIRDWITETQWLPKADGYLVGISIFDMLTYNLHASAGYAELRTADVIPGPYLVTDQNTNTARFDLWQDISLPFTLGAFRLAPYLAGDLAYYSNDLSGDSVGRLYGAAGIRGSLPLSRYYGGVQSDLFNVNGIYHKMLFSGNYMMSHSNVHINQLPQLDRLNDDATDQALRDIYPRQPALNPNNAAFLTTSNLFDPQYYALRRLIDNRADSLDSIDVFQMGLRQRWQTKRGVPGNEHVIDWMTLNLGASFFPRADRDNFGQHFGIIEYDWLWNIGDRTALVSNGWFETIDNGPRVWNMGAVFNRPDRTSFYLGYRQIDPLESKAVIGSLTLALSAKYAVTGSSVWDFGTSNNTNTLVVTRIGTDFMVSMGFSYNSTLSNFGVVFEILPNLLPGRGRFAGNGVPGIGTPQ